MPAPRTWEIEVEIGRKMVRKTVTLAEFQADLAARRAMAAPIMDAWKRGDLAACEKAQAAMRAAFDGAS